MHIYLHSKNQLTLHVLYMHTIAMNFDFSWIQVSFKSILKRYSIYTKSHDQKSNHINVSYAVDVNKLILGCCGCGSVQVLETNFKNYNNSYCSSVTFEECSDNFKQNFPQIVICCSKLKIFLKILLILICISFNEFCFLRGHWVFLQKNTSLHIYKVNETQN